MRFRFSERGGRAVLPLFLLLHIVLAPHLGAAGGDEGDYDARVELEAVETLIEEGRLDEAIEALVDIAQTDPEQMERAQKLILDIQNYKNGLNSLFAEAVDAIDTGDSDRALEIIQEIKQKFPHLNRSDRNKLIIVATAVGRQADFDIRDGYFERAAVLLEAQDYQGAVDIYREGIGSTEYIDLFRHTAYLEAAQSRSPLDSTHPDDPERWEIIWEAYSTIAPEGEDRVTDILLSLDTWNENAAELPGISEAAVTGISVSEPEAWEGITADLNDTLGIIDGDQNTIRGLSLELNGIRLALNSAVEDAPEEFHYERIGQFLNGRPGKEGEEGIYFAQERLWEESFSIVADLMSSILKNEINSGRDAYLSGTWESASGSMGRSITIAGALNSFLDLASVIRLSHGQRGITRFVDVLDRIEAYTAYAAAAAPVWNELTRLGIEVPDLGNVDFENFNRDTFEALADRVQELVTRSEVLSEDWTATESLLGQLPGADAEDSRLLDTNLRSDLARAAEDYRALRLSIYVNAIEPLFDSRNRQARAALAVDTAAFRSYALGVDVTDPLAERHPSDSLENQIQPALADIQNASEAINDFMGVTKSILESEPPIDNPEEVIDFQKRLEELDNRLQALQEVLEDIEREAQVLRNAALSAETSAVNTLDAARRDIAAAEAAVRRGKAGNDIDEFYSAINLYNVVEQSLDKVDTLYLEGVLPNDKDIAGNSSVNADRQSLRSQMESGRGQVAIDVKENAVEEGRNAYDAERYSYGVSIVSQAQDFWKQAYDDGDPETDDSEPVLAALLQQLLNGQQALQQTVIEPNDPLYAEMNQYLNLANRYYEAGRRIAETEPGNADAMLSFGAAEGLLAQVLNTFPGNEAALLLEQKISYQKEPDVWNSNASILMAAARRAVISNDKEALREIDDRQDEENPGEDSDETGLYVKLKVLTQIDPDFPGLSALIYDVEVLLEIIIPETPERIKTQSRQLAAEAGQVWDRLGTDGSDRAVELLNDALTLWPENIEASALKNEVLSYVVPAELPPLPADLDHRLTIINKDFDEGKREIAEVTLDVTLELYPEWTNDPRVLDVIRRVRGTR